MKNTLISRAVTLVVLLQFLATGVRAEEGPHPLWNPRDWDHVRDADQATTRHLSLFRRPADARKYCAKHDRVVWLDRHTGLLYDSTMPAYGLLMPGFYVCERQALAIGARAAPQMH